MQSIRKLVNKPRIDDWSPLAKFFYADEALNTIANELDSFDGRRDPERCNQLVNKLRQAQDRVLHIISEMLMIVFPNESERACRDYRAKFPDEIIHDNLPGQLWFGAECLAAGSNIVDHEVESEAIRPMARALTKHLDKMREILKDQALRDPSQYTEKIKAHLRVFDHLFADFEFSYVSAMVPVKSVKEYDAQLDVTVLFSESITRAIQIGYITQENIDNCDPNVMIALPRLAIVWGLLYYPDGALNLDLAKEDLSEMFRHFHRLLLSIRDLLKSLRPEELQKLEVSLVTGCSSADEVPSLRSLEEEVKTAVFTSHTPVSSLESESSFLERPSDPESSGLAYLSQSASNGIILPSTSKRSELERTRYSSSDDLIHRLFVCIAGVADQLQTNYSSEVRKVLKMVLQPVEIVPVFEVPGKAAAAAEVPEEETGVEVQESLPIPAFVGVRWIPDGECDQCTGCSAPFTVIRRRHHCRNCGRIFCGRCSSNQLSLPELGYDKKVRVCNLCFLYKLNPFSPCATGSGNETPSSSNADQYIQNQIERVEEDLNATSPDFDPFYLAGMNGSTTP
uniref:FYVE-type domain-containing protein n=1 Tax=Acrobeloides nanus TaxID=290746 RepID=A0A914C1C3_9BILA